MHNSRSDIAFGTRLRCKFTLSRPFYILSTKHKFLVFGCLSELKVELRLPIEVEVVSELRLPIDPGSQNRASVASSCCLAVCSFCTVSIAQVELNYQDVLHQPPLTYTQ